MALRMIGLTRKSRGEDEGTHGDQRARIEAKIKADEGPTLLRIEVEHKVSGKSDWRKRGIGRAVESIERGEADGIIVAYMDRITREPASARAAIWRVPLPPPLRLTYLIRTR